MGSNARLSAESRSLGPGIVLDFTAPMEPGKGAAGFTLGDSSEKLLESYGGTKRKLDHGQEFFDFGPVCVWAKDGVIDQIGVRGGYTGRLIGSIGIGSTIQQVMDAIGLVAEDDDDTLVAPDVAGLCFETEGWHGSPGSETVEDNLDARITQMFVFVLRPAG